MVCHHVAPQISHARQEIEHIHACVELAKDIDEVIGELVQIVDTKTEAEAGLFRREVLDSPA